AFFSDAQPSKFKACLFHIVTGSYDIPTAHITADGYYTNKAPGGVAYRCSFRVTEASYLIERLVTNAALELGIDQAEFRQKNFIQPEQFPYTSATGWIYDSGDYPKAMDVALDKLGIPASDVAVEEGDTDTAPYGLGTYASRSTPVAGAATAMVSRKLREKARLIAAHLLEAADEDLAWERGKFYVKGSPDRAKT